MRDIEDYSNYELNQELKERGYSEYYVDYDYVDSCLFEDIISVFDSLSCAKKQELHDLIINFK